MSQPPLAPAPSPWPEQVALPVQEAAYHHFLRTPAFAGWRPVVAILVGVAAWLVATSIGSIPLVIDVLSGRADFGGLQAGRILLTPWVLLGTNLSLAALIPIAMLCQWGFFGQRPGWISSVVGRIRWGWLLVSVAMMLPLWLGVLTVQGMLGGETISVVEATPSPRWPIYLAIILITTPLQAAGEEYGFRGLVNRGVASWFRSERTGLIAGALVSSALFAMVHGSSDPWANGFYFGLGLLFCLLVWRTGGLETAIVLHTVNNLIPFLAAVWMGQIDQPMQMSGVTGDPTMLIPPLLGLLAVLIVEPVRRRLKVARTAAPGRALIASLPTMPTPGPSS